MKVLLRVVSATLPVAVLILQPAIARPSNWSDADRAAASHALKAGAGSRTVTLDLSDPLMARFLKRHYEISGLTADHYPGLHKLMAMQAAKHLSAGVSAPRIVQLSGDLVYEDLATLMLAVYPTSSANTYLGSAVASMEAPAPGSDTLQISYASLCFYDANSNPIGTCTAQTSFGSGQYFPVNNTLASAPNVFTAAFTATYYDVTTQRYVAQLSTLSADAIQYPSAQTITHPVILSSSNNSLKAALVCTSRTVNANANPGKCDYGTYSNSDVMVQMNGSVTYAANQSPQLDANGKPVGTGSVALVNTNTGGQCQLAPSISGSKFFAQPQVTYSSATKVLSWNFTSLDFGPAANLICAGDGTGIQFTIVLQTSNTGSDTNPIVAAQYSVPGTVTPHFAGPNAGALLTPMLRVVAGCLDPDTKITLADGSTVAIAQIHGEGEKLQAKAGTTAQVVGTVNGKDAWLYEVRAANGMQVRATAHHPFVTTDGRWRSAASLKTGDQVLTAEGTVRIASVHKVAYGGPVVNLVLAHPANETTLANDTFYANGFLVGGNDAQQQVAAAAQAARPRVHSHLPAAFRVDYANHLKALAAH